MPVKMKPKAQNVPQLVMYQNRLQEYAQKSAIPLPVYQTLNEGKPHAPKFRSIVFVDGVYYTSQNTFSNRKAAEQDVAKLALDDVPQLVMYKNRLQEYAEKSAIPLPVYQTLNEGKLHAPKFRSTVFVDGVYYTSQNTFSNWKAAEQDVAKLALDGITKKIKEEGCPLINEDTVFCKSILIEYAVKLNMEKPQYKTIHSGGLFLVFVSSLEFDGVTYTGKTARSKREAEQLAARGVINSILGTFDTRTSICEIIKSKSKLYAALHKAKDLGSTQVAGTDSDIPLIKGKSIEVTECKESFPSLAITDTCLGQNNSVSAVNPPLHEFKRPRLEPSSVTSTLPIPFVPPVLEQPLCSGSSSAGERNLKKKKAN